MSLGQEVFTDLDFADDVSVMAEMLEVLILAFDMKSPCNALYQRIRQSEGIIPSSKSGDLSPVGCTGPLLRASDAYDHIHTYKQLHS